MGTLGLLCHRVGGAVPKRPNSSCPPAVADCHTSLVTPWTSSVDALVPTGFLQETDTTTGKYRITQAGSIRTITLTRKRCRASSNPWQRIAKKQSRWYYIKYSMQRHSNLPHYWLASTSMITATGPRRIRLTGTRPAIRPRQQNWSWP